MEAAVSFGELQVEVAGGFGSCFFHLISFEVFVTICFDGGVTSTNSDVGMLDDRGNGYPRIHVFARKGANKITVRGEK